MYVCGGREWLWLLAMHLEFSSPHSLGQRASIHYGIAHVCVWWLWVGGGLALHFFPNELFKFIKQSRGRNVIPAKSNPLYSSRHPIFCKGSSTRNADTISQKLIRYWLFSPSFILLFLSSIHIPKNLANMVEHQEPRMSIQRSNKYWVRETELQSLLYTVSKGRNLLFFLITFTFLIVILLIIYLLIWLHQVSGVAHRIFPVACGILFLYLVFSRSMRTLSCDRWGPSSRDSCIGTMESEPVTVPWGKSSEEMYFESGLGRCQINHK